jgi:hypothetical protein
MSILYTLFGPAFEKFFTLPGIIPCLMIAVTVVFARQAWKSLPVESASGRSDVRRVTLFILIFGMIDWLIIAWLPKLKISFGPQPEPLFLVLFIRLAALVFLGVVWDVGRRFKPAFLSPHGIKIALLLLVSFNLVLLMGEFEALVIEPSLLETTYLNLDGPAAASGRPLRILHISDLHVERITRLDMKILDKARVLQPDLILLTGDYVNLDYRSDPQTWQDTHFLLAQLEAPYGVYAITGTQGVDTPENVANIFEGLQIKLLQDEVQRLEIHEQVLFILGVNTLEPDRDAQALRALTQQVPEGAYKILLYHSPDLIETAVQEEIQLYLAGHTHGGQVRLPFYGALVTFSRYGKEFESGLYRRGSTTLYVSRGVGLEGMGLPRIRFLCLPEITFIELANER